MIVIDRKSHKLSLLKSEGHRWATLDLVCWTSWVAFAENHYVLMGKFTCCRVCVETQQHSYQLDSKREVEWGKSVGVKRRSVVEYGLQSRHASSNAIQLINKWRDYHLFTIWHAWLNHAALLSRSLHHLPPLLLFSTSFFLSASLSSVGRGRLRRSKDWSSLLPSFAYMASICQAVIGLARSTLLGPPHRHAPWSPCSPNMSRGWWVSPSWTGLGPLYCESQWELWLQRNV